MFILDTNIVSEVMRNIPSTEVMAWLDERPIHDLYVTAVTQAEILTGIAFLPEGRRRSELTKATEHAFNSLFNGRLLPFDSVAAHAYAEIASARRSAGRPISQFDGQIAAIARSRNMTVATRNVADYGGCSITVINPWSDR